MLPVLNVYIHVLIHVLIHILINVHVHVHVAELGNLDEFVYLDKSGNVDGLRRVNSLGHKC